MIEFKAIRLDLLLKVTNEATIMLAEKFFLVLEALRSRAYTDGSPRVVSTSPHVPIKPSGDK